MLGGAFLCFEGFEKLAHRFLHSKEDDEAHHEALKSAVGDEKVDVVAYEKQKVKGAIRTDFILSAEIIAITLGTVANADLLQQFVVLSAIAVVITLGVYGLVGAIVKLDDLGLLLVRRGGAQGGAVAAVGRGILTAAPWLMKTLSVVGTAAMFLVGGGILAHGIAPLHHAITAAAEAAPAAHAVVEALLNAVVGIAAGAIVLTVVTLAQKTFRRAPAHG